MQLYDNLQLSNETIIVRTKKTFAQDEARKRNLKK